MEAQLCAQSRARIRYFSSHIEGAESELVYPATHIGTDTPRVANEIRRILLEHLAALDGCGPSCPRGTP